MKIKEIDLKIIEKEIDKLGFYTPNKRTITINSNLSNVQKNITLVHEFIHVTEAMLLTAGIIKRRFRHTDTDHVAMNLVFLLVMSGKYKGISKKEMIDYWSEEIKSSSPKAS